MMGNSERVDFEAKKQYKALTDDSINNMPFRYKNEAMTESRQRCLSVGEAVKKTGCIQTWLQILVPSHTSFEDFLSYELDEIMPTFQGCYND